MWLMVLIVLVFYFEIHTRLIDLVNQLPNLANSLSYKFYVALTGTSSILSGTTRSKTMSNFEFRIYIAL